MNKSIYIILRALRGPSIISSPFAVIIGSFFSYRINFLILIIEIIGITLAQMGANLINDYEDLKVEKISGLHHLIKPIKEDVLLLREAYIILVIGLICGAFVVVYTGLYMLILFIISGLLLSYGYSGHPIKLYRFGEFAVPISWFILTLAAFYSQTGFLNIKSIFVSTSVALFVSLTYLIHQFADYKEDVRTKKPTLLIKFGINKVVILSYIFIMMIFVLFIYLGIYYPLIPLIIISYFILQVKRKMNPYQVRKAQIFILIVEMIFIINSIILFYFR